MPDCQLNFPLKTDLGKCPRQPYNYCLMGMNKTSGAKSGLARELLFSAAAIILFLSLAEIVLQLAGLAVTRFSKPGLRPGAKVIVCLGDSHTYGVFVSKEEAYPVQLEKLLNRNGGNYQVINLGAPGKNSTQVLQELPEIIHNYHPDAVVVLVGVNNGWNISGQEKNPWQKILMKSKIHKLLRIFYYRAVSKNNQLVSRHRDTGEFQINVERSRPPETEAEIRAVQRVFLEDMAKIINLCRDCDVKIVLMNYAGDKDTNFWVVNAHILQVAQKMGVPVVDNYSFFMSRLYRPDGGLDEKLHQELFLEDMHLTPTGYGWVADNLYQLLTAQLLLK